ncbi:nuclear transport factor 2 family protein [Halieaceae bacterium IMCC14734]|uniref:Nuclear transport factor 2 family protein n=1 Tax=Candidatus Litorirhabdus singularis TaxID=2518993 RepID=A0ABT3TFJ0_9GAMM|nr:nuclear transport factor 2 family protein [Candidatus Litorirhabdus singularis]MCX2980536.1 nuclear transport factor 2 family protein [Candidatus Litorirhabdus singularis]
MAAIDQVLKFAAGFEETYIDDNWERLLPFFTENAKYTVVGGPMACEIEGRSAILAGLKKSLDGLDRRFSERRIEVTGGPEILHLDAGEKVMLNWEASYELAGLDCPVLPGSSVITVVDGLITHLQDEYDDVEVEPFAKWLAENGADFDGRYV